MQNIRRAPAWGSLPQALLRHFSRFLPSHTEIILPGLIFFLLIVAMNWQLFVIPMIEDGDAGANALQVQNAKHLHELLGNYSRWHFHHPGPFLFYLFAAGEAIFYDLLHIVPAPLNAEYLAEIAFSVTCLFLSIHVFNVNVGKSLFPALAVLVSVLFLYTVETAVPGSAIVSIWPPYMGLFCFLLLTVACASVAAGNWKHLPLLALSAMIMVHSHVAQILFAATLSGMAVSTAAFREFKWGDPTQALRAYKYYFAAALGIIALFLFPMGLDAIVNHPSNIARIGAYLREHHGEHNSLSVVVLYVFSFFTYSPAPETLLASPGATLRDLLSSEWSVRVYWSAFVFLSILALTSNFGLSRKTALFLKLIFAETALICLLFGYWARSITGPMYNFNGYFFFSVQLLVLFALCSFVSTTLLPALDRRRAIALACSFTAPVLLVAGVGNGGASNPTVLPIVSALKALHLRGVTRLVPRPTENWPLLAGVASYLERSRLHFCVEPQWEFMFGARHTCGDGDGQYRVDFALNSFSCQAPCSVLYTGPNLYVVGAPIPSLLELPALVTANDNTHQSSGFNDSDGSAVWSKKESFLRFYLSPDDAGPCLFRITGTVLPGRPVVVKVNGGFAGVIDAARRTTGTFTLESNRLVWNGANTMEFDVPNAGPVGTDNRELGFMLEDLLILRSVPKESVFSNPVVFAIPGSSAGALLSDITWQPDGGWKTDGFYPDIGRLAEGLMWGSWNHNDALTGKLTSGAFSTRSQGCVVVPIGHGPSILNQRVAIVTDEGATVAEIPLAATDGKWQFYEIHYDRRVKTIRIAAVDRGTGFGQWVAVGQPRSCKGHP